MLNPTLHGHGLFFLISKYFLDWILSTEFLPKLIKSNEKLPLGGAKDEDFHSFKGHVK